jgi:hypothetical protein
MYGIILYQRHATLFQTRVTTANANGGKLTECGDKYCVALEIDPCRFNDAPL